MAISAHLEQLLIKHAHLDEKIQNELRRPAPDTLRISQLKKEKLKLKEQIGDIKAA